MIAGIQILGLIFALSMLYLVFLNFKRREITAGEFLFWIIIWGVFLLLIFLPSVTEPLLQSLHIVRALDLFVIVAFMLLTVFHFSTYSIIRKTQRKVELLVRSLAIEEYKKKRRKA